MKIEHNSYADAQVQSLGLVDGEETAFTIGLVLPGVYDFGQAGPKETISITSGQLVINGKLYKTGEQCVIESGQPIKITANCHATYLCTYG